MNSLSNAELVGLFECPVCYDDVIPPIYQCESGHLMCASCRDRLHSCPVCRGHLGNIRNLAMEQLANKLKFPCVYKFNGCQMFVELDKKDEHESICDFRPYNCNSPGVHCPWQGPLDEVVAHMQERHPNIVILSGETVELIAVDIDAKGDADWFVIQKCFGHHFLLQLKKQEDFAGFAQFFGIVQMIGSRQQVEEFSYKMELNGNGRRLSWEGKPKHMHESVDYSFSNYDCLNFDNTTSRHLAQKGALHLNVSIFLKSE